MDESLKYFLENELSGSAHEALNAATQALYFDDNSDFRMYLWKVLNALLEGAVPEHASHDFLYELAHHLNPDWNKD